MHASQIVQSWKLPATSALVVAALIVFASGAKGGSHLLSEGEKESVLAANGLVVPPCFYIGAYPCNALTSPGGGSVGNGFTACGDSQVPHCAGDCTNACGGTLSVSWACLESKTGPYGGCPNFDQNPNMSCGFQKTGGSCASNGNGYCACFNGNNVNPAVNCGLANTQPANFPPSCP